MIIVPLIRYLVWLIWFLFSSFLYISHTHVHCISMINISEKEIKKLKNMYECICKTKKWKYIANKLKRTKNIVFANMRWSRGYKIKHVISLFLLMKYILGFSSYFYTNFLFLLFNIINWKRYENIVFSICFFYSTIFAKVNIF